MTEDGHYKQRDTQASRTDAIEPSGKKAGWIATFLQAIRISIPAGYEDENGFHFGADSHHPG
jgi:hypothetical protein